MSLRRNLVPAFIALTMPVLLAGCADLPKSQAERADFNATNDPLEPMNRVVFDVNDFLDRLLLRPLAELYRVTVPPGLRDRVAGIVTNMKEPVIFANNLLQGDFASAGTTAERFGINTTLGVAGMWDVATGWDIQQQNGDFGQTLASWGVEQGPYLVLPLLGPSNFRDAIGLGIDSVMTPWGYIADAGGSTTSDTFMIASIGADGLVRREQNIEGLDALREGSLDFYAQMRSVAKQYRAKQLGGSASAQTMPKFDDE